MCQFCHSGLLQGFGKRLLKCGMTYLKCVWKCFSRSKEGVYICTLHLTGLLQLIWHNASLLFSYFTGKYCFYICTYPADAFFQRHAVFSRQTNSNQLQDCKWRFWLEKLISAVSWPLKFCLILMQGRLIGSELSHSQAVFPLMFQALILIRKQLNFSCFVPS